MTKKCFLKKYEYVYDEYYDCYICPNEKILEYTTTFVNTLRTINNDCSNNNLTHLMLLLNMTAVARLAPMNIFQYI